MIIILRIHFWMILIDGAEQTDRAPHSAKVPECTKRVKSSEKRLSVLFKLWMELLIERRMHCSVSALCTHHYCYYYY